ncbi:MAG: nitroreductase family protein [Deltaproteobacteria bacterium]|jgi:nitroreductase|nr:nitroreductase family protein [Deltaproteobacteria bacterium]
MEKFFDLVLNRQSCRDFADKPLEREKLVKIVDAARLSPSACNSQPWSFVAVDDPQKFAAVAEATLMYGANSYISKAKAMVVALEEFAPLKPAIAKHMDSQVFAQGDLGGAVLNICYAAEALGVGSCILGAFDRVKIHEVLDIPQEKKIFLLVALGYPNSAKVRPKARKPLEEVARFV